MNSMNRIVRRMRARRADIELMRAIDRATPGVREELLTIAQR